MLVHPTRLAILTTRRCTAACDHCCVGASPRATSSLTVERIHGLLDEAARIPSLRAVCFTGGECFLLGRDLDALVAHAAENGFLVRAVSNGYWAVNAAAAQRRLRALRAAGLRELVLSTGTFHQRFVPFERVATAARAAAGVGLTTIVSIETCDQADTDASAVAAELADLVAAGTVQLAFPAWVEDAGDRGEAALTHRAARAAFPDRDRGRRPDILDVLAVTPDQQLVACCGTPLEELPRLRIGSLSDAPLDVVIAGAPDELIKMWLHVAGPSGIAEFVGRHLPGYVPPRRASICEVCVALQRDEQAMRIVAEHAADVVQDVVAAYLRMQSAERPSPAERH
jgi:hypothetical protein